MHNINSKNHANSFAGIEIAEAFAGFGFQLSPDFFLFFILVIEFYFETIFNKIMGSFTIYSIIFSPYYELFHMNILCHYK